jgi:hypothetical protein
MLPVQPRPVTQGILPHVVAYRSLEVPAPLWAGLDALNLAARRPSPFSTRDYLEVLLAHDEFAEAGSRALLLVAFDDERAVGWLPLRQVPRRVLGARETHVEFLVTHDTDRPGIVARPEDEVRCAEAFFRHLIASERWSRLELMQQETGSPLIPPPNLPLRRHRSRLFPANPNCTIPLHCGSVAQYFRALSKHQRENVARLGRRLVAAGAVEFAYSRDPRAQEALFGLYLDVEGRSWKSSTAAAIARSPRRVALFRSQCRPGRVARPIVHLLLLDGAPIAAHFGVEFAGGFYAREMAFDEAYARLGPGHLLLLLVVRDAIASHVGFLNMMGQFGYYKAAWGAHVLETHNVQLFRVGSASWLKSWAGDLLRWRRKARDARASNRFNPSKRHGSECSDAPAHTLPGREAERVLAAQTFAALEQAGIALDRLTDAGLAAALPFKTGHRVVEEEPVAAGLA